MAPVLPARRAKNEHFDTDMTKRERKVNDVLVLSLLVMTMLFLVAMVIDISTDRLVSIGFYLAFGKNSKIWFGLVCLLNLSKLLLYRKIERVFGGKLE